jgi:predicted MFS family arabinose efflux permease
MSGATGPPGAPDPSTRRSGLAVAILFAVNGATFSNWLPRLPEIRDVLGIGNAGLGATLLGGGLGGILGSILVGRVMDRTGSKRLVTVAACSLSIGLPLVAFAPTAIALAVLLTALGTLDVFNDVAMNAQGVFVQERMGRSIMNRLHAMWSLGFTGGALVGSAALAAGVGVRTHLVIVGAALLVTVIVVERWLVPVDPPAKAVDVASIGAGSASARRVSPVVVAMALAAVAAAMLETMPNDWAAVYMRDVFEAERAAGFGTVAVAGAMLLGRLGGDHVLDRVGERRLLAGALVVCAIGVATTAVAPDISVALAGLAIWGVGMSVVFPQLYATAARLPGTSAGTGLGSMLLGQRFGGMVTAVTVGALAEWRDLRFAFASVGAFSLIVLAVTVGRTVRTAVVASPGAAVPPLADTR